MVCAQLAGLLLVLQPLVLVLVLQPLVLVLALPQQA
jgi:hypothetical protein